MEGGALEVLATGVSSFQVDYLSADGTWASEWHENGLPRAVRISLVIRAENPDGSWGNEIEFRTLIPIPAGG